jgi:CheY-like chemotaxis protein/two-component sensor histidine kinase
VTHVARLVDDLMDVARLERGKITLKTTRVDLNRVVASAVEACLPEANERGHQLIVQSGSDALMIDADEVRVAQIVTNLIGNAIKFSTSPCEIRVATSVEDDGGVITVEDQGIGFDPAVADDLFSPFVQASATLERSSGGLGMGLTIVKRLVELHRGSVSASSEGPGKGARFLVRIPLAQTGLPAPAAPDPPRRAAHRRRVVVVDDNCDIRETLRMLLTSWGHEVATAEDGPSGVDRVLHERPDVALIDIGLPLMNGYDVARAIRKVMPNGSIRLIAVTGYGQPVDKDLAARAGFDMHLLKPIEPEVLERLLSE